MNRIFLLLLILVTGAPSLFVSAQTKIIAHKSHSGQAGTFSLQSGDHLGLPPEKILAIEKISDTALVFHRYQWTVDTVRDTVYHHPLLTKDPTDIKKLYGEQVAIKGFARKKKKEKEEQNFILPILPNHIPPFPVVLMLMGLACSLICTWRYGKLWRKAATVHA